MPKMLEKLILSVDILQGRIDELAELALASGADIHQINAIWDIVLPGIWKIIGSSSLFYNKSSNSLSDPGR